MRQRRVLLAMAALLAAITLAVSGCGGSQPESELTGTDTDETAPPEAQDAIITGLETMFTWFPARDTSPMDADNRALPFLGPALRDGANNKIERGNSVCAGVEGRERRGYRRRAAGRRRTPQRHPGHRSARRAAHPDREGARPWRSSGRALHRLPVGCGLAAIRGMPTPANPVKGLPEIPFRLFSAAGCLGPQLLVAWLRCSCRHLEGEQRRVAADRFRCAGTCIGRAGCRLLLRCNRSRRARVRDGCIGRSRR